MKKITIIIYAILCALLAFLSSCTEKESPVEVSSVSLNTATIEMVEGETCNLVATVLPKDAEYDGVTWASSNVSVASVQSGTVTALKEGTATITASAGGKSSTCNVKVSAKVVAVTSITLDKTSLSMQVGEIETLTATVKPADASDKTITWGSSDVSVATVTDGKVTAKKSGSATISAKSGNCVAECVVTVLVNAESVTLDKSSLSLAVGESAQLTATVSPADAVDKNVTWTSSDESVAIVNSGKVTAMKAGKTTITATCGGKTAECIVTVTVPVSSISIDKSSISLAVGGTVTLTATVKPDDATDKSVTWSSSNASVATVSEGKVVALKSGQTTITARSGGKVAECAVTVVVPVTGVTLDKTSITLVEGETATLTATVKPDNATDKTVVWRSSDESVAKVSDGKVIAIKTGVAKIEVAIAGFSTYCDVTVESPNNVIYYTARYQKVEPFNKDAFGANIISNEYSNGNGRIVFDAPVTAIGTNAFYVRPSEHTDNLTTIKLPNTVSTIGENAFNGNRTLTSINIPDGVAFIGKSAFSYCYGLTSIDLPPLITSIEDHTFDNCHLSSIVLPKNVTKIGVAAFAYTKIQEIDFPNGLQSIGYGAFTGSELAKVIIPSSVVSIGDFAFSGCSVLVYVEIEEGPTTVPWGCFMRCLSLSTVKLPSSIKKIDQVAFTECSMLKSLYLKAVVPPSFSLFGEAFDFNTTTTIYVPRSSVDAYKAAKEWSRYKDNIKGYDF